MVFEVGSVTKQFTAAAILMLQEQGKLSVKDDFTKYLPDFPTHGQKITIEHLLTHTSGIPSYTGMPDWFTKIRQDMTVDQLLGTFRGQPLEFNPGEQWKYNNSGYALLGAIIEKVSGKSYERFIEDEIFKPLGMTSSYYGSWSDIIPKRAAGYDKADEGYRNTQFVSMTLPYAAGAILSTVDDLWKWDQALSSGKLLKKESMEPMFKAFPLNSGLTTHYGYGWGVFEIEGRRAVSHGGDINGFHAELFRMPEEGLFVAILSNNTGAEMRGDAIAQRIASKMLGKPVEDRKAMALDPKDLQEYAAVYRIGDVTRSVTLEDGKLFAQRSGSQKLELAALDRDRFFYVESGGELVFQRDAQGKISGATLLRTFGPDEPMTRTNEPPPAERQAAKVDPALYDAYAGKYELRPGFILTIFREGDQIFGQPTGQPKAELFPESETRFFLKVVDAQVDFVRGEDGRVGELVLHQGGRDIKAKRIE
jgi:CubicO group peptidase (beta-lactamase class C family)